MHHTAAYTGTVGQTANTQVNALTDQILPQDGNNNFLVQESLMLVMSAAMSATLNRARLVAPPYRQIALPYIYPAIRAATPPTLPNILDLANNPLRIPALNPLGTDATSDLAMGTERVNIIINLLKTFVPAPVGDIYTLRATGTTTQVANTWTQVPLTFDQPIIQGRYSVIGGDVVSATGVAWRLTADGYYYRPGGLAITALGNRSPYKQYWGGWGEWFQFQNTSLPRLEVLANSADTAQTLFLQVIKIA